MLRDRTLPATLSRVMDPLRPCFTAPSFETFTALVAGLVAQPVSRTVCGMLTGAGLARVWHHTSVFDHERREGVQGPVAEQVVGV